MQHMQRVQSFGSAQGQKGFTIIELVVVILLLGILAATALPRFIDVTDEAHDAAFEATVGGFTTGVAMYRAQYIANGQPSTVTLDNAELPFNSYGYPAVAGLNEGATGINTDAEACEALFDSVLQAGRPSIDTHTTAFAIDATQLDASSFDFGTDTVSTDFRIGYFAGGAEQAGPPVVEAVSPICYYIYTAQYQGDNAAIDGGRDGVPYFTYVPYTGAVEVGHTSVLP